MPNELCNYGGADTTAAINSNDDGTFTARCHCGAVVITNAVTTAEAGVAIDAHRKES